MRWWTNKSVLAPMHTEQTLTHRFLPTPGTDHTDYNDVHERSTVVVYSICDEGKYSLWDQRTSTYVNVSHTIREALYSCEIVLSTTCLATVDISPWLRRIPLCAAYCATYPPRPALYGCRRRA